MNEAAAQVDIDIRIEAAGWRAPALNAEAWANEAALAALGFSQSAAEAAELSILLTDDSRIADLNSQWRGKSGATNVLSFPGDAMPRAGSASDVPILLGDVAVALETVITEADTAGISVANHFRHLVVHGVLHLLGYDHENDEDAARMERCEIEILGTLGVPDPYKGADRRPETVQR